MISEPELTGGPDEGGAEVLSDADRPPFRGGARRPWVWAVGGAVLASAVWAGGLRLWSVQHGGQPDLHGYALGDSPCAGNALAPLTEALHASYANAVTPAAARIGPALDQIRCTLAVGSHRQGKWTDSYDILVSIDLHKRTDPRVEFDDQVKIDASDLTPVVRVRRVSGLGDKAIMQEIDQRTVELKVLHGGAVFTLALDDYAIGEVSQDTAGALHGGTGQAARGAARYESAMVEAMRNVMKAQQKSGS